jgi:ribulose-phosphate 3-epimerase
MAIITPTILTNDAGKYRVFIEAYYHFARRIQVDISDGIFTPNATIPEMGIWWPSGWICDVHMMVAQPSEHVNALRTLKPHLVIFHVEVTEDLMPTLILLKDAGIKVGIALMRTTFPGKYADLIRFVDHVLLFSGNLGSYGGEADLLQLEKVEVIRGISPDIEIGWDGGAKLGNVREIARAGVDVINVGSAIAAAEKPREIYELMSAEARHGSEV